MTIANNISGLNAIEQSNLVRRQTAANTLIQNKALKNPQFMANTSVSANEASEFIDKLSSLFVVDGIVASNFQWSSTQVKQYLLYLGLFNENSLSHIPQNRIGLSPSLVSQTNVPSTWSTNFLHVMGWLIYLKRSDLTLANPPLSVTYTPYAYSSAQIYDLSNALPNGDPNILSTSWVGAYTETFTFDSAGYEGFIFVPNFLPAPNVTYIGSQNTSSDVLTITPSTEYAYVVPMLPSKIAITGAGYNLSVYPVLPDQSSLSLYNSFVKTMSSSEDWKQYIAALATSIKGPTYSGIPNLTPVVTPALLNGSGSKQTLMTMIR